MSELRTAALRALEFIRLMNRDGWMLADHEADMQRTVAGLEAALAEPVAPPEAQTEAEKVAYCAGWWDALAKKRSEEEKHS